MKKKPCAIFRRYLIPLIVALSGCTTVPHSAEQPRTEKQPRDIENLCSIFAEKEHWVGAARTSHEKWNLPVELMMAIIRHESAFIANSRPRNNKGELLSSAYGYAQALDGTWSQFKNETARRSDKRTDFADAVYFVGWYSNKAMDTHPGLSPYDVIGLYVLYHNGWSSLQQEKEPPSAELLRLATKVYKTTLNYHQQLKQCSHIAVALYENKKEDTRWF